MNELIEDIESLFDKIKEPRFFEDNRPGGDIPYFILPYDIKLENEIDNQVLNLKKRLSNEGLNVLIINLYDVVIDILQKSIGLKRIFDLESKKDKAFFMRALQSSIDMQLVFKPYIKKLIEKEKPQVIFINGVAQVYPYLRSHIVLNNLQSITGNCPVLMFYPGEYSGQTLKLFNTAEDANYYRAYNIKTFHI
ncbi:MAG: DUF1788 domain-containing protein [Brumimicrobium sp.]|nr:DUF1788 domain-containing protein [Brumimicrobium sp.]